MNGTAEQYQFVTVLCITMYGSAFAFRQNVVSSVNIMLRKKLYFGYSKSAVSDLMDHPLLTPVTVIALLLLLLIVQQKIDGKKIFAIINFIWKIS